MYFDRRLWELTKGFRGRIAIAVAIGLVALAAGVMRFALLGWLLARLFNGEPVNSILMAVAAVGGVIVSRAALEHLRTTFAQRTAARIQEVLRGRLYDQIGALGPAWFANHRTGGVMLSLTDGVEQLQPLFGQYLPQLCIAVAAPFLIFAVIAWWDVPVAGILLVFALLSLALPALFHRWGSASTMSRQRDFKAFGEDFLDAVQGLPTLKAFGQSHSFGERLAQRARALFRSTLFVVQKALLVRAATDLGIAGGAATAIAVGAWRVSHGMMSMEALLIVLMAGTEVFRPLRDLRSVLHQGLTGAAAAIGVKALLDAKPPEQASHPDCPNLRPVIDFDEVTFAYSSARGLAHDKLSFSVNQGERVAIVGPSGSGKSSIVRLLLRFDTPQRGIIRIGGFEITGLDPDHVRAQIAVVQQDSYLFYGTVEDNLRLGKPEATREEVESAARAANAHDFIMALPRGYATVVGERGTRLSGGQRQRLAIARALLKDAPILILDEALSSVDAENEAVIQSALDRLMANRTTLILAHRLSSVIDADRIIVIDCGKVVEAGSHATLMANDGPYRRLMGAQAEIDQLIADHEADQLPDLDPSLGKAGEIDAREREIPEALTSSPLGPIQALATLFRFILPWRRQLLLTTLSGVGRVYALIGVSVLSALIVAATKADAPYGAFVAGLAVLVPLAAFLQWNESWRSHDMAYDLLAELRIDLFAKLDKIAPAYLLRRRSGDLAALATHDVETVEYFFAHVVAPAMVAVLVPITVLVAITVIAWPAALVLAPFLLYAVLVPVFLRRKLDDLGVEARRTLGELSAFVTDTVQGLSELVALNAVARRRKQFVEYLRRYQAIRSKLLSDLSLHMAIQEAVASLGNLAVVLVAAVVARGGATDVHLVPLLALLASASFVPVAELAQAARQLADAIASTRRLHAVHVEPVIITDGSESEMSPRGDTSIAFEEASFRYPTAKQQILDNVSFRVKNGARIALVGASGAGKSTIASLLLRFWDPNSGVIRINGTDLRDLHLDALRAQIALVAQDTYLFNDTLGGNVRLAKPDANEQEVLQAIQNAALGDFIASLPEGLATPVGERGVQLSGGQRQRVAIARAFLKNAPILILDEATSHLDAVSEKKVGDALEALMANRTTVLIAHRLSTIRSADLIIVLAAGRVREAGTHHELLLKNGLYARFIRKQTVQKEAAV